MTSGLIIEDDSLFAVGLFDVWACSLRDKWCHEEEEEEEESSSFSYFLERCDRSTSYEKFFFLLGNQQHVY